MQPISLEQTADLFSRLITDDNASIYEKRAGKAPWDFRPKCLYFYYVRFLDDGLPHVSHYFHDNGKDPIEQQDIVPLISRLAINARADDQVPPKIGTSWRSMIWRRKSYFVILMDSANWALIPRAALLFNPEKGGAPNQSFFDAEDLQVPLPAGGPTRSATALCAINHMKKNKQGQDLDKDPVTGKPESQNMVFTLFFRVVGFPDPHTIDPGGTNQGPPGEP